jgi:ubiquinone/menaquinone biosynthesis C-methylase UbiE
MFSDPKHNIEQFMLGEGARVVEFGAGSGHYAIEAGRVVGESGKVFAIDVQPALLERIKTLAKDNNLNNVETITADLENREGSKLREGSCDAGIVANVLFQIENKESFSEEVARVIRPGGKLLVVDWTDSFGGLGPHPENVVSSDEVKRLFEMRGFNVEKTIYAGDHHFGIIMRKR